MKIGPFASRPDRLRKGSFDGPSRARDPQQPDNRLSNDLMGGEQPGERPELNRVARLLGLKGDMGNMIGLVRMLRDSTNDTSPAISTLGLAAAAATPTLAGMSWAIKSVGSTTRYVKPLFGHTTDAVRVAGAAFGVFRNAVFGIPKVIGTAIGAMRPMPVAYLKTADAAEKTGSKTTTAISLIPRAMLSVAGRVAAAAGNITKALAQMPSQLVKATSTAIQSVGVSLTKIGAVTAGLNALLVGPAVLAARSWAAYGEKIRGVQNDLLRYQLTAEEASIISRVAEQTGESIEELAKQIRGGGRDFSRWRNELMLSGTLMSGAGLSAALALSRAYYSLKESIAGLKNALGAALGPVLTKSTQMLTGMVRGVTRWVSENKPLVVQVFKVAAAVGIAAGAITMLGGAIAGAGTLITPFTAWLAMIAGVMAIVEVRTGAGRSMWTAYGDSVRQVYSTVVQYLGQMMDFAGRVIGGVKDALMAGDLAAAVDVMWNAAKAVWFSALLEIDELTSGTFGGILQSLAAGKWATAGEAAINALQQAWLMGMNVLAGAWDRILDGFHAMVPLLKQGLADLLDWTIKNVFFPLIAKMEGFTSVWGMNAASEIRKMTTGLMGIELDLRKSIRDEEENPPEPRTAGEAQIAREKEIERLKERQTELAKMSGEQAERERTANQKALDASLAAAEAAREAAAENQLKESDFAVALATKSITRFSGEALGLSVGRGDEPAKRTAKLVADLVKEVQDGNKNMVKHNADILRLLNMGGFQ